MARNTRLKDCVQCKQRAAGVGVYESYYLLGAGHKLSSVSASDREPQVKGSFRARGYCPECFLRLAEKRQIEKDRLKWLRSRLRGEGVRRLKK